MSCSAYLYGGLEKKTKEGLDYFKFHKMGDFFISHDNQVLLGITHNVVPLFAPSKKGLSFSFSLAKKRIYLETQLKGEFTDLF